MRSLTGLPGLPGLSANVEPQMTALPERIASFVRSLHEAGRTVWLIGSRANGTGNPDSDWDLLVFGDEGLVKELSSCEPVEGVDLFVVYDGNNFRSPWNHTADWAVRVGSLSGWAWRELSSNEATYNVTMWPNDWGSAKRASRLSHESPT
jgi:predicted nucleotidyltransferase